MSPQLVSSDEKFGGVATQQSLRSIALKIFVWDNAVFPVRINYSLCMIGEKGCPKLIFQEISL